MTKRTALMAVAILMLCVGAIFGLRSPEPDPPPVYDWTAILGDPQPGAEPLPQPAAMPAAEAAPRTAGLEVTEAPNAAPPEDRRIVRARRAVDAVGVSTHSLEAEHLDVLERMGVVNLRRTLRWKLFEEDRAYAVHWDDRLRAAIARGFRVLVVLDEWPPNPTEGGLAAFLAERVADHPEVEAWQIGNEAAFPNLSGGEAWARIHNSAAAAVKRGNPGATIVTMGFSPEQTREAFARQFLATARRDVVAVHVYRYPASEAVRQLAGVEVGSPIWVTEFGLDRNMVPVQLRGEWERVQQTQWQSFIEGALALGIPRVYGYSLFTDEVGRYGPVESHGLLRPDGSWRPAAAWLQRYLSGA